MTEIIYSWTFNSKKQRGNMWYIIAISLIIGLIIWGFLVKQYGLSFVLILISGLFYFIENNSSDTVSVNINELGINADNNFYDFAGISSFSILYEEQNAILVRFFLTKKGMKILDLEIDNKIAIDLKSILPNFIKENEKASMSNTDKIIRLLKL